MRGPDLGFSLVQGTKEIRCRLCEQHCPGRRCAKVQIGPGVRSYFCEYCVDRMFKSLGPEPVKEPRNRRKKAVEEPCPSSQ